MHKNGFITFGAPQIEAAEIEQVVATLRSGWIGTGPKVAEFERNFAAYKGAPNAVAIASCTAALHLSILAAGIKPGDEVITTPLTFCATVNAIIHAGGVPVLADVDPISMNIDPYCVASKITGRTRAIVVVHFAGRPCNMELISAMANRHNLKVIEDCAHAIETEYHGAKAGCLGDFGCFSFYVTKNMTTGEGGMVLAKQEEDAARIKILALHGMSRDAWKRFSDSGYRHYQVVECGFKYNMMDLQAAIGIEQLKRLEKNWLRRQEIWARYNEAFAALPLTLPAPPERSTRHAYHLYTILLESDRLDISRDEFLEYMTREGIGVGVHYLSLAEHPVYQKMFGWRPKNFPISTQIGKTTVSLPLSARLSDDEITYIIDRVTAVLTPR